MKKNYLFPLVIATLLTAFLLAGCADKAGTTTPEATNEPAVSETANEPVTSRRLISCVSEQQIGEYNLLIFDAQVNTTDGEELVASAKLTLYKTEQVAGGGLKTQSSQEIPITIENMDPREFSATFSDGAMSGTIGEDSFTGTVTIEGTELELNMKPVSGTPWKLLR
jgi:hypothetical protein